jgi:hypothetical protein
VTVTALTAAQYREGVEHSAAILRAAGYDLVPLLEPVGKVFDLLGVCPHGLLLVTVVRDWPETLGLQRLGVPPRWPVQTARVIHRYLEGQTLPEVRVLS